MTVGTETIVGISASVILAVFGLALALLVIWQDPQRRSNQYFVLCMFIFSCYGAFNAAWQVAQQFDLPSKPMLYSLTTFYILALTVLYDFVLSFADMPSRIRRWEYGVGLLMGGVFIGLTWVDQVYTNLEPVGDGSYHYDLTWIGLFGIGAILAYLGSSVALLYIQRSPKAREVAIPLAILGLGAALWSIFPSLRPYSVNSWGIMICTVLLGRLILKHQVFKPLLDLNSELALRNTQLIEATNMKSQFLANMSHELRTPLNSIIGYTELVLNRTYGELNNLQDDRLQKVIRNGHSLLALINDVLDLSKIEAGRLNLTFSRVPVEDMLDSLLHDFEPKATAKGLAMVRGYSKLPALYVDESRTRQVFSNLLSNAIKFTDKGVIIIRGHFDAAERQVIVSVTDTGIGIDPANQERVFEAFQQGDSALTRRYEGTGLGLAISRRLVEMHAGRIWFESTIGRGSTFHVALPAADDAPDHTTIIGPEPQAVGPVILSIDDDCDALQLLRDHLEKQYRVYSACSANDGLRLAHELRPALITLDVLMPGIDGWQVLEALRRDPSTAGIPVVIISASDDQAIAARAGANGFISKPVQPAALKDHMHRLIAVGEN